MLTEKLCPKCKQVKTASDFAKSATAASGLYSYCKECSKRSCKERRKANQRAGAPYPRVRRDPDPEKTCTRCLRVLPIGQFYKQKDAADGHTAHCAECQSVAARAKYQANKSRYAEAGRQYRQRNQDKLRAYFREYDATRRDRQKDKARRRQTYAERTPETRQRHLNTARATTARLRKDAYALLGGRCYCCEMDDIRFLTIDHPGNDGHGDIGYGSSRVSGRLLLQRIITYGDAGGRYRLACFNCNMGRAKAGHGGECPHHPSFDAQRSQQEADYDATHTKAQRRRRHYDQQIKERVFALLGGRCYCCGETVSHFLTVDHIQDDGYIDRKRGAHKMSTYTFCKHILSQESSHVRYRLACYNCNCGRAMRGDGVCPHHLLQAI